MREFLLLTCAAFLLPLHVLAQDENPAAKAGTVQITFLPPPMEGTVSLGLYNKAGKLVRTLKREANPEKDFTVGLNGLITTWDGKDDRGTAQKPGAYSARGFMVKTPPVSGEAFHCNDWITEDDAPHPRAIHEIWALPKERLALEVELADGGKAKLECGLDGRATLRKEEDREHDELAGEKANALDDARANGQKIKLKDGKLALGGDGAELPELHKMVDFSYGKDGSVWVIDRSEERVEVQQYAKDGEFLRRLSVTAGEPVPVAIAASAASDLIFLLEEAKGVQRVRALALEQLQAPLPTPEEGAPKSSTWRIVFSKSIKPCGDFATAAPQLGRTDVPKPEAKLVMKLAKNPLGQKAESPTVEMSVVTEKGGSFLQTTDGLPLCRLTDTPDLKWAVILKDAKGYSLVQSDGAVVEEYRLGKFTGMMAFDAGEYELK